jgi:hypothetical protein
LEAGIIKHGARTVFRTSAVFYGRVSWEAEKPAGCLCRSSNLWHPATLWKGWLQPMETQAMTKTQRTLLNHMEYQLMRLRGCIDAMVLIDDAVEMKNLQIYRNSASTLHLIMDDDLKSATSTLDAIFAAGRKAS